MGNCASSKSPKKKGSVNPRRKCSVYFPAQSNGMQKYAERECKANGLNFKDIQAIYNKQQETTIQLDVNNQIDMNEQESTHIQGGKSSIINMQRARYTAKLKKGDTDDDYAINKDTFKNFDFNRNHLEESTLTD